MKKHVRFAFVVICCSFTSVTRAQDIHFSQVLNNPLFVNPASVGGYDGYQRLVLNYRTQWASVGSPFKTMGFSYDLPIAKGDGDKAHLGLGLNFYSDKAGDSKFGLSQGNLTIGGIVPVTRENFLSAAVQVGYAQRSANLSSIHWATQFNGQEWDPDLPSMESATSPSFGYLDLSTGVRWEYRSGQKGGFDGWGLYDGEVGIAAYHLTRPGMRYMYGTDKLNMRLVFHGSGRIDLPNAYVGILPYFCIFLQGPSQEINTGLMARFRLSRGTKITGLLTESALSVGGHYRFNDAIVPQIMFELGPFGLGVAYDYNISTLKKVSRGNGGLEVALKFHDVNGALFQGRKTNRIF